MTKQTAEHNKTITDNLNILNQMLNNHQPQQAITPLSTRYPSIANRIVEFTYVEGKQIRKHPYQWRDHPIEQKNALRGIFTELGIANGLPVYRSRDLAIMDALEAQKITHDQIKIAFQKNPSKKQKEALEEILQIIGPWETWPLTLIDGHARSEIYPDQLWPVFITNLTDEESRLALQTYDPISWLSTYNLEALTELHQKNQTDNPELQKLLDNISKAHELDVYTMKIGDNDMVLTDETADDEDMEENDDDIDTDQEQEDAETYPYDFCCPNCRQTGTFIDPEMKRKAQQSIERRKKRRHRYDTIRNRKNKN